MAAAIEEPGFSLPSEFLTDDDFTNLPSEFPYHFETHTDNLLQKFSTMSTSPHTALAYLSLPSAKYDAVEDLIYQAAAHVAKLRVHAANSSSPAPPSYLPQFHKEAKIRAASVYPKFGNFGTRAAGGGVGQVAWAPHQVCGGSAAAKKACAGTGVFLPSPRRYNNNISVSNAISSGPRRKQGCSASSSPFVRASPQSYTKPSYTSIYRFVESQPEPLPQPMDLLNYNSVLPPGHAMVLQQRHSFAAGGPLMVGRDQQCLPRKWTY